MNRAKNKKTHIMKAIFELQSALKATDFAVRLSDSDLAAVTGAVYLAIST